MKNRYLFLLMALILFPCCGKGQMVRIDSFDIHALRKIALTRTEGQTVFYRNLSAVNNYVNAAVPLGLLVAGAIKDDKAMRQNALYVASSAATASLLNLVVKKLVRRPRPFRAHKDFIPVYINGGYSFPSGHTSVSMSTATALARAYPKWYVIAPSFLWAGTVGYSRMYLGMHNPSDVMAGAALGIGTGYMLLPLKH